MTQTSQGLLSPLLQRARIRAAVPHLEGSVLDFGCGSGALAAHCDADTYRGVDRDPSALATARSAFPEHSFTDALPAGRFDTFVALAVIEHISDPGKTLSDWLEHVSEDGRIVLTTPHPNLEWAHELGASVGLFSHGAAEEHEEMLDARAMTALAESIGLKITSQRRFLMGANQLFVLEPARAD